MFFTNSKRPGIFLRSLGLAMAARGVRILRIGITTRGIAPNVAVGLRELHVTSQIHEAHI